MPLRNETSSAGCRTSTTTRGDSLPLLAKDVDETFSNALRELGVFLRGRGASERSFEGRAKETRVVKTPIRRDSTAFLEVSLLGDDRSDTTGTQACCASANELSEALEKLALGDGGVEGEKVVEEAGDGQKLISGVAGGIVVSFAASVRA